MTCTFYIVKRLLARFCLIWPALQLARKIEHPVQEPSDEKQPGETGGQNKSVLRLAHRSADRPHGQRSGQRGKASEEENHSSDDAMLRLREAANPLDLMPG